MRWVEHVARMGEKRNSYRVLVGKPRRKSLLRIKWEDDIKTDFRKRKWCVNWCYLCPWKWIRSRRNFAPAKITVLHFFGDNYASKLNIETVGSSEAIQNFLPDYTASNPRRQYPSYSPSWDPDLQTMPLLQRTLRYDDSVTVNGNKQIRISMQPAHWAVVPAAGWESGRIMEWRSGVEETAGKIMNW